MSSSITLSAATRQNLLSLQDTASLLATTQSRLSTGKKVNSALDNPINFFTATNLSARSTDLSSLLDGISNGVQTIQAANTGLSKLQNLTSQLKSTAQQALASTNAFTSKASTVSTSLNGATAANLLSTGPTVARADNAVGTLTAGLPSAAVPAKVAGSVDYQPTAAPSTMRGTTFTATTPTVAKATGTDFTAPANAVAGTVTGGASFASAGFGADTKLVIEAGSGGSARRIEVSLTSSMNADQAVEAVRSAISTFNTANATNASTVTVSRDSSGRLAFKGDLNGDQIRVSATGTGAAGTGFGATVTASTNNLAAGSQTLTINGKGITISGGLDGAASADVAKAALEKINAETGAATNPTGVTATLEPSGSGQRLVLTGKADGTNFTVTGGAGNSLGFAATATTTANGAPPASQTLTINGTQITIAGGGGIDAAVTAINAQSGTTGVSAMKDPADQTRLLLTGKADGSAFTVASSNPASSGFSATPTSTSLAATVSGVYTPDGTPATTTASDAFRAPASAVAGTLTAAYTPPSAGGARLSVTSGAGGSGNTFSVDLAAGDTIATAARKFNDAFGTSGIKAAVSGSNLVFTGKTDGSALSIASGEALAGFTTAGVTSTDHRSVAVAGTATAPNDYGTPPAGGTSITITSGAGGSGNTVTVNLTSADDDIDKAVATITGQLTASGISVGKDGNKLKFTGKADGSAFTVESNNTNAGFTVAAVNSTGNQAVTPGTVTGSAIYATPGAGGATLTITSGAGGAGNVFTANLAAGDNLTAAIGKITTALTGSGISVADDGTGKLKFTGKADGSALNVASSGAGAGFTATPMLSSGQRAAESQTLTIASGGNSRTVTIPGGAAGDSDAKVQAAALQAINDASFGSGGTGVTASASSDGRIVLKGAATGAGFTVTGGPNSTAGFGTSPVTADNGEASAAQTLTINGTGITIRAGATQQQAIDDINTASSAAGLGVSASVDPDNAGKIKLTGKADGSSFAVQSSNSASSGFSGIEQRVVNNQGAAQTVTVNGTDIAIAASATLDQAIATINAKSSLTGVTAGKDGNKLTFTGGADGSSFTIKGSEFNTLGLASTEASVAGTFDPGQTTLISTLGFKGGDSFSVNGQTVNLTATDTIGSLTQKVGAATNGAVTASYDATTNKFSFTAADSNTAVQLGDGSTATSKVSNLGFASTNFASGGGQPTSQSALAGKSLTVQVGSGTAMSTATVTFGTAPGQVSTLAQLNEALAPANAQATIDSLTGKISITTSNDVGAQNLSIVANGTGNPFTTGTAAANLGGDGLNARNNLVQTYNDLLKQMDQLASDAGFNGVNLLSGDNLTINFNEKGTSQLKVQGSATSAASLGLSAVGQTNFQESSAIKKIVDQINSASSQLQSRAAALGSNLAVVQNRQDFTKQIINVLDTGAANLTSADLNEEAANSQALSTRNSLAISALSLANQSQQGILQLLR
ncbi:flagellin hook IN motif-containing protein [Methylorubrum populi]|uniref:flagellin hook IN motif-containing protein n=1 Tax=Methylorubrum populi TaxID=223967 RepID=UPI003F65C6C6